MAFRIPTQLNKAKEFLDGVLALLPEDQRDTARAKYSQAQDELSAVAREIGEAVTTVNTKAAEQADWWEKNGRRPANDGGGNNPITAAVDKDALMKDVNTAIGNTADQLASQGLYLASVIPTIIAQHHAEFGEVLDGEALIKAATEAKTDLKTYYTGSVAVRRQVAAEAKRTAELTAATEAGRLQGLKEAGNGNVPYPVNGHGRPATTLDGLRAPADGAAKPNVLEAAVATAMEVMSKQ